jgi:hypothetical protein
MIFLGWHKRGRKVKEHKSSGESETTMVATGEVAEE